MILVAYGYIPSYSIFVNKRIVKDNFYIDKEGFFECEIVGNTISKDMFCNLQNRNSLKNIPLELEELEFFITHVKQIKDFNFKTPTFVKESKKFEEYKIGDFIIPNGGNPGTVVEIDIENKRFATRGSNGLNWYSPDEMLKENPSIYKQFK